MIRQCTPCSIIGLILLNASFSHAHDVDYLFSLPLEKLQEIEVQVASKTKESWLTSSGTVYVIDRKDIKNYGWRDLKEILSAAPNMDMLYQYSWLSGGQRGFTGNRSGTLLMIDGREVQNLLANEAFIMNNFPAHRIERIEILQGTNSTLYGGNATQGVINIISRLGSEKSTIEAGIIIGEVNTKQANGLITGQYNEFKYGISASAFQSDLDYDNLKSFVFNDSEFSRNPILDQIRNRDPNRFKNKEKNLTFDFNIQYHNSYAGVNLSQMENMSGIERIAYDFGFGDDSRRGYTLTYLGQEFDATDALSGFVELSVFREYKKKFRLKAENEETATSFDDLVLFTEREDIGPSYRYRLRSQWQYDPGHSEVWVFGYDGWRTDIGSKVRYVDTGTGTEKVIPDTWPTEKEVSDKHALYGQYSKTWTINQTSMVKMTSGLRYNQQELTDNAWLPRLSTVYQSSAHHIWKITYGEAFRPPTIFEFELVEDQSLESQTMKMIELNYTHTQTFRDIEWVNIAVLYQMEAKNFYQKVFDEERNVWQTIVSGENTVEGFENQLKWQGHSIFGFFSLRYLDADKTTVGNRTELLDLPKTKVKLGLGYTWTHRWSTSVFINHWSKTFTEANTIDGNTTAIQRIPSWQTLNVNIAANDWQLSGNTRLDMNLYIENVLDKTYYHSNPRGTSPYQFIQPPRNVRLQLELSF
jgi:outer membrane receptor for ferrienterochelin and colicin